ncbi:MAG: c-type cytochrome, partial [Roseovarius sp.]
MAAPVLADPAQIYREACADCHGAARLGGQGPALIPESLGRMRGPNLIEVIAKGRAATQMPGFDEVLSAEEMAALADWLHTPLAEVPVWGAEEIDATRW